jgi:TPR repeat protein
MPGANLDALEQAALDGDDQQRIELANRLIEYPADSAECQRGLNILRAAAEGCHGAAAQWLLGIYYIQTTALPGAHAEAAHWLERAATAGVAPAIDRLANLYLRGLGVPYSRANALNLLQGLADIGFQRAAWDVGYLLSQDNGDAAAATAFARACALAYPPAYYSLGLRFALGAGVTHDAGFARALLLRANDVGYPDALAAADELAPQNECSLSAQSWYELLKQNHAAAKPTLQQLLQDGLTIDFSLKPLIAKVESYFAALGHPQFYRNAVGRLEVKAGGGTSVKTAALHWEQLAQRPRVAVSRNFATREECAHLIYIAAGALAQPEQYTGKTLSGLTENSHFTGRGCPLGALSSDAVVRTIEQRIAQHSGHTVDTIEPCSIIAYEPGEEYHPHVDFFGFEQIEHNRKVLKDFSGQRVATFLLCLKAPDAGGETVYDHCGLSITYQTGMATLHFNVTSTGAPDARSLHHGRPVKLGQKWLMRTTLRENSLYNARGNSLVSIDISEPGGGELIMRQ